MSLWHGAVAHSQDISKMLVLACMYICVHEQTSQLQVGQTNLLGSLVSCMNMSGLCCLDEAQTYVIIVVVTAV